MGKALEASRARLAARRASERAHYQVVDPRVSEKIYQKQFGIRSKTWHQSCTWLTHEDLLGTHADMCKAPADGIGLDVCCGSGVVGASFKDRIGKMMGLDLTPEMIAMAEIARAGTGVADWARPVMKALRDSLNETAVLSVRTGDHRVDVEQVVGRQAIRRVVALGEHKLLTFGAPSLSILSCLSEEESTGIIERLAEETATLDSEMTPEKLNQRLETVRADGYCEHMSHHLPDGRPGSAGVAAPVIGKRGEVVAALGVSVPIGRYGEAERERIIAEVLEGAREVSALLGRRSVKAA